MTTKESNSVRLSVSLDLDNEAVQMVGATFYISQQLTEIARRIDGRSHLPRLRGRCETSGKILDENGNAIGEWSLDL